MTIVISKSYKRQHLDNPYIMFLFKVKTKLQYQLEEYLEWKARFSIYSAKEHKEVLLDFIKKFKYKDTKEISLDIIREFRENMLKETNGYTTRKAMQALRCFTRYYKKHVDFNPEVIQDDGISDLSIVDQNAMIIPMIEEQKMGRPYKNIELIKTVKRLRDNENISFRKIGKVVDRDVSYVYRMYKAKI